MGFYNCGKDEKGKGVNFKIFHKCYQILGFLLNLNTKLQLQLEKIQHINLRRLFLMACESYWFVGG